MKTIFYTPIYCSLVLILNSCGTSPDVEESEVHQPITQPSEYVEAPIEEPVSMNQAAIPLNSAMPIAVRVAGRPGFVFNPYNQNMVEVDGMSSGTKVRDPQDPDSSHIFVVP